MGVDVKFSHDVTNVTNSTNFDPIESAAASMDASYFLTAGHKVYAVGQNIFGQVGSARTSANMRDVVEIPIMDDNNTLDVLAVAAGNNHVIFKTKDGDGYSAFGLGANHQKQLGLEETMMSVPTKLQKFVGEVDDVSAGGDSTCITKREEKTDISDGTNVEYVEHTVHCFGTLKLDNDGNDHLGAHSKVKGGSTARDGTHTTIKGEILSLSASSHHAVLFHND